MEPLQSKQRLPSTNVYRSPSATQQAAVSILSSLEDVKVKNWLSILQSLQSGYKHHSCPVGLSRKQLAALTTLRTCRLDDVLAWLKNSRTGE